MITGVESILVGLSFLIYPRFTDNPAKPVLHAFSFFGSATGAWVLVSLGFVMLFVGMLKVKKYHIDQAVLSIGTGLWLAYFMTYLVQDFSAPTGPQLSTYTVLIGFVVVRLLVESSLYVSDENK